jgi:SP family general alpha glucoside:H+ symporter-like MFS transporter
VLNELRENQSQTQVLAYTSASPGSPQSSNFQNAPNLFVEHSPNLGDSGVLEPAAVDACINAYLERIYPVVPFITEEILRAEASNSTSSLLSRQFIVSFCAYVVTFGKVLDEAYTSVSDLGTQLLSSALRIQAPERISTPTLQSVFISFFLYGAYAGLGRYRQGWFYLREATTLFMMQKSMENREGLYSANLHSCLFWVLVVSERYALSSVQQLPIASTNIQSAHGIRKNRPITLPVTASSPSLLDSLSLGLQYLASLFRPFDEVFFAVWNGSRQECSKEWLLGLERDVRTALPITLSVSNEQIANLRVSQLWLQIKLWELFPRFGFLSSESVYECLTFRYPITVARDLSVLSMKLPIGSLQIHGVGMTEKIFDIACALADVLPFVSTATSQLELGPVDYLTGTTSLLAKLPDGETKFVPLLLAKVNELLPELVKGLCDAVQIQVPLLLEGPMSPDSRFVYEEEVGRGLYADLRRGR